MVVKPSWTLAFSAVAVLAPMAAWALAMAALSALTAWAPASAPARHLVDGHHIHVVGGDHVALFHGEVAGAPVDGRIDGGEAELDFGVFGGGCASADGGLGAST